VEITLPDAFFIDRDELGTGVDWELTLGVDIERPEKEGEGVVLQLRMDTDTVDIPMHARYLAPNEAGRRGVEVVASARAGWKCGQGGSMVRWS
jgi:hypothetical protein